jgi:uncharacterized coiled-coil protein SlyX
MESTIQTYIERIAELEKKVQEKDKQIAELEQVILKMYTMYGVKKDDKFTTREDQFLKVHK